METQTTTGGKDYPLLNFEQFERLVHGFFFQYSHYQFIRNDTLTLFSCALFTAPEAGPCPDSIVTYSAVTDKWYMHTLSSEFKASEGDSLTEVMNIEMPNGLGIPFPGKEKPVSAPLAHTFEQFKFLLNWILSADKDHCEFVDKDTLFSCALSPTYPYSGTPRELIVTYSACTRKWYMHTFFDGFNVFEGDTLDEL